MRARAIVKLEANLVPESERHLRDLSKFETVEIVGEGDTWAEAMAACVIPDGALISAWFRE